MPYPENVKVALQVEAVVREAGAIPATVAVINGFPKVGLHPADFEVLGQADKNQVFKALFSSVFPTQNHVMNATCCR